MITEKDKKEIVLRKSNQNGQVFALILDDNGPDSFLYTLYSNNDTHLAPALYISDSQPEGPESPEAKSIINALENQPNFYELVIHDELPEDWEDRA